MLTNIAPIGRAVNSFDVSRENIVPVVEFLMKPDVRKIEARSVLTRSGIPGTDWCVNPYVGCAHACRYCYAVFMRRFTGHREAWGDFVDARVNAPDILRRQLSRAARGTVMLGSVTDGWQPAEKDHRLSRRCLEALLEFRFPVRILTKSPLLVRDLDLLVRFENLEAGFSITTDDERMRALFEPGAPPVSDRIRALAELYRRGCPTWVFIGPLLPHDPARLASLVAPLAGRILIDRMNYPDRTRRLYREAGLGRWLEPPFVDDAIARLEEELTRLGRPPESAR
jgi:DNA repair photolyase